MIQSVILKHKNHTGTPVKMCSAITRQNRRNQKPYKAGSERTTGWKTNPRLLASSESAVKQLLEKCGLSATEDMIKAATMVSLSKSLRHTQRKNRREALAASATLYHLIANRNDPDAALKAVIDQLKTSPPRGADVFRKLVEVFFDYGITAEERSRSRQYAAADANALRYIIRNEMDPNSVLQPEKGESPSKWARREAEYRGNNEHGKASAAKLNTEKSAAPKSLSQHPSEKTDSKQRLTIENLLKKRLILVDANDGDGAVAVLVARVKGLSADEAKRKPTTVRAKLQAALDKAFDKAAGNNSAASTDNVKPLSGRSLVNGSHRPPPACVPMPTVSEPMKLLGFSGQSGVSPKPSSAVGPSQTPHV